MKIPIFKTDKDLATFVEQLTAEQIRSFGTEDWNHLYAGIDKLCDNLSLRERWINRLHGFAAFWGRAFDIKLRIGAYKPELDFVKKHSSIFIKLNKHYRPDPKHRQEIISSARRLAQDLFAENPGIKTALTNFPLLSESERLKIMNKIRNILYRNKFPGDNRLPRFKPSVHFFNNDSDSGNYNHTLHRIQISRASLVNPLYTFAHELWHSVQTLRKPSDETTRLYQNNNKFYLKPADDFNAYRRQPLEYDGRTFQIYFTSEIFKRIGAENFNIGNTVCNFNRFMYHRGRNGTPVTTAGRIAPNGHLVMEAEASPDLLADWQTLNRHFLNGRGSITPESGKLKFDLGRPGRELNRRLAEAVLEFRPALKIYPQIKEVCRLLADEDDIKLDIAFNDFKAVCSVPRSSPQFYRLKHRLRQQDLIDGLSENSFAVKTTSNNLEKLRLLYLTSRLNRLGIAPEQIKIGNEGNETLLAITDPSPAARNFLTLLNGGPLPENQAGCGLARFNAREIFDRLNNRKLFLPERGLSPHLFDDIRQRT